MVDKRCTSCLYIDALPTAEPCMSCNAYDNWKDINEDYDNKKYWKALKKYKTLQIARENNMLNERGEEIMNESLEEMTKAELIQLIRDAEKQKEEVEKNDATDMFIRELKRVYDSALKHGFSNEEAFKIMEIAVYQAGGKVCGK